MKKLYLVRHAKSSWIDPALTDFERPLNERGRHDAPLMGRILHEIDVRPDVIFSSPANRALATARFMAPYLNYSLHDIRVQERIYEASLDDLLGLISGFDDEWDSVMIFGHNPAFTDIAEHLTHYGLENMPTCGVFGISLDIAHWSEIEEGKGKFLFFEYPKKYRKGK